MNKEKIKKIGKILYQALRNAGWKQKDANQKYFEIIKHNNYLSANEACWKILSDNNIKQDFFNEQVTNWLEEKKAVEDVKKEKKKASKQDEVTLYTSKHILENNLYEQIIKDNKSVFVSLNSNEPKFSEQLIDQGIEVKPIVDLEAVQMKAIMLPNGIKDYGTEEELVKEIQTHIHKYCEMDKHFEVFSAYYVLLTWLFDKFNTIPYLSFLGDTNTGKSRRGDVIGGLCYKRCKLSGAITPAPIYRMIKRWAGTMIIEEADFKGSDEKSEIVTILNCGFEKGNPVLRCDQNDANKILFLPTYSPKIILRRRSFIDKALESRCLTEQTKPVTRKDIPPILTDTFYDEQEELRQKLLMFRLRNFNKIEPNKILEIDLGSIDSRLRQATISFASLFVNIPILFEQFKAFLREYNEQLILERQDSYDGQIVECIFKLLDEGRTEISAKDIKEILGNEKATVQSIGKIFKSLGFVTKAIRSDSGMKRILVLDEALLGSLKSRYSVSSVSSVSNTIGGPSKKNNILQEILNVSNEGVPHVNETNETHETKINDTNDTNDTKINGTNGTITQSSIGNEGSKIAQVLSWISKAQELIKEPIRYEDLVVQLKQFFDEAEIEPIIEQLKSEGSIYEPRAGYIAKL
jgi:hypothetical protein